MNVSHEPLFELDTLIRLNYVFTGCCESWIIRDLFSFLLISLHAIHYACVIHCDFFSKVFFIIIADKCWSQPVESSPPGIYNSRYKELVNNLFSSRHENFTWNHFRNESNKRCIPFSRRITLKWSTWNRAWINRALLARARLEKESSESRSQQQNSDVIRSFDDRQHSWETTRNGRDAEEGVGGIGTGASNRNCSLRHFNDPKRGREKRRVAITVDAFTFSSTRS